MEASDLGYGHGDGLRRRSKTQFSIKLG